MSERRKRRILVVGTVGDAGQAIVDELARAGDEVLGADVERLPLGLRSRHLVRSHRLPDPSEPAADAALARLVALERPDALLAIGTRPTMLVARNAAALARTTAVNVCDPEAFAATYDHAACRESCEALGIPVPAAFDPAHARTLLAGPDGPTLVVKPRHDLGAAAGVRYVDDVAALDAALASSRSDGIEPIVHAFVPGEPSAMRAALLVFDAGSRLAAAFTIEKIRQWPLSGGVTAVAESTDDPALVALALPFFERWRWRGVAEVEAKIDARTGRLTVIEINGRMPAYGRFASLCGLPLGRLLVDLARSPDGVEPMRYPAYAIGRRYVNPGLYARTLVAELRQRRPLGATLARARADARGGGAQLARMLADPAPMLGRTLRDFGGRGRRHG